MYDDRKLTDEEIMAQFTATGNPQFFDLIVAGHYERIQGFLTRRLKDAHLAEDVTQEVFLKAAQHHASAAGRPVAAWLTLIAVNAANNLYARGQAKRRGGGTPTLLFSSIPKPDVIDERLGDPADVGDTNEQVAELRAMVAMLPKDKRQVLDALYLNGTPIETLSESTGVPVSTLNTRRRRALAELRQLMEREPSKSRSA